MNSIPDFTDTELWTVRTAAAERYGKNIDLQLADSELRLERDAPLRCRRITNAIAI